MNDSRESPSISPTTPTTTPTTLLNLPAELRLKIYGYVFEFSVSNRTIYLMEHYLEFSPTSSYSPNALPFNPKLPPLCHTSKQLYLETVPFYLDSAHTVLLIKNAATSRVQISWFEKFGNTEAFKAIHEIQVEDWRSQENGGKEIGILLSRCVNTQLLDWDFGCEATGPSIEQPSGDPRPQNDVIEARVEKLIDDTGLRVLLEMEKLISVTFGWRTGDERIYFDHVLGTCLQAWVKREWEKKYGRELLVIIEGKNYVASVRPSPTIVWEGVEAVGAVWELA